MSYVDVHDIDSSSFPVVKTTNVARPRLLNSNSKQSITASEDYYSLSDFQNSSESDERQRSQVTIIRYTTPPSRFQTPKQSHDTLHQSEQTAQVTPQLRAGGWRSSVQAQEPIKEVAFDEESILGKHSEQLPPPKTKEQLLQAKMERGNTVTPGVDDTPYIRFAIDQLTRDEDVRGSRAYQLPGQPGPSSGPRADDDYPVDRILPNQFVGRPAGATPPPRNPSRTYPRESTPRTPQRDTFVPFHPPKDSLPYPQLTFLPGILRPLWLGLYIFLVFLMLVGLFFCAIWSPNYNGMWTYKAFGDGRYFVFQYLPTILGMILLLWLMQIQTALKRIAPFLALASESAHAKNHAAFLDIYPTQFLLPHTQYFHAGQPVIGVIFIAFWLFNFTIPLLASAFTVIFYGQPGIGNWRWASVQGVIWATIALYIILLFALVMLGMIVWRSPTGLRWDPRTLADLIALHERANIMNDYSGTEIFRTHRDFYDRLSNRTDRLGYWHTSQRPNDIFYAMGEEGGATRVYSIEQGRIREKGPEKAYPDPTIDIEAEGGRIHWRNLRDADVRLRYLPWYLRTTWIIAWILIALALLIAFLVVSFVDGAVTNGFSPDLTVAPSSHGWSAANFLYSFIPALIGLLLFLLYQPLDLAIRRLAPFTALQSPTGATAQHSLLLDYPYRFPLSCTIAAIMSGNIRVTILSLVSFVNLAIPILAGGMFWAQWYTDTSTARISAQPSALYALCFFLALYAVSLFILLPGRAYMLLPHESKNLAELTSWIYMSNLCNDRQFHKAGGSTKAELVTRLLGTEVASKRGFMASLTSLTSLTNRAGAGPSNLTGGNRYSAGGSPQPYRYGFGVFIGRDGREHLGIDRVVRGENRMEI